jgi:hypothetical protein
MTDTDTTDIDEPTILGVTLVPQPNPATHDPRQEYVLALVTPRNGAYLITWVASPLTDAQQVDLASMTDCARSAHVARKTARATAQGLGYRALRWDASGDGDPYVLVGKFDRKTLKAALTQEAST